MAYETVQHAGRKLMRWIPDSATKVTEKHGYAVVYVYRNQANKLSAVGYIGNSGKSTFHYIYKDENAVARKVTEFFANVCAHKDRVKQYRAESNSGHSFKVGDIVTNSWGYDQTNVDWYRVTKTSKNFVWLKPICATVEETGFMSGNSAPRIDVDDPNPENWGFKDTSKPEEQHKAHGEHVGFEFGSGSKWDGQPMYCSWYA